MDPHRSRGHNRHGFAPLRIQDEIRDWGLPRSWTVGLDGPRTAVRTWETLAVREKAPVGTRCASRLRHLQAACRVGHADATSVEGADVGIVLAGEVVCRGGGAARAVRVTLFTVFVLAEVPDLTHSTPTAARLQNHTARIAELVACRGVARLVGDQHRSVAAGDAVGRGTKAPGAGRTACLICRVFSQDEAVLAALAPVALVDEDTVGDRLANSNTVAAVADKAILTAVTERRGRALGALFMTFNALLIVEELTVKASQAPAVVC